MQPEPPVEPIKEFAMRSLRNQPNPLALLIALSVALLSSHLFPASVFAEELLRPHPRSHGTATQLFVDGKPFLVLDGELGNSIASSPEVLDSIWPRMVQLNLDTVLVPNY
jgi:hypothetical protein